MAGQRASIAAAQSRLVEALGDAEGVTRFRTVPYVAMTVDAAQVQRLAALPGITSIVEDVPLRPLLSDSTRNVDARRAWRNGFTGSGQVVAVIDTGTRYFHRAFEDAVVAGACYSRNVPGIASSLCPNGENQQLGRQAGRACTDFGSCDHGTHVAGIAMGTRARHLGVGHGAELISIMIANRYDSLVHCAPSAPPCLGIFMSDVIQGLERVAFLHDRGAVPNIASVNMSLGGGAYTGTCDNSLPAATAAVQNLRSRGIAVIAASGNGSSDTVTNRPACISSVISVGSTTKDDVVSSFSNHNRTVALMAPGGSIVAPAQTGGRNALTTKSGTSMAAPHVAGAWAVLREAHPWASVDEVFRALYCTGIPVSRDLLPRPIIQVDRARRFLNNNPTRRQFNFHTDQQVAAWSQHSGNWSRVGSVMRVVSNHGANFAMALSPFCGGNVRVDASIRLSTDIPASYWPAGVVLAGTAAENGDFSAMFFMLSARGTVEIRSADSVNRFYTSGWQRSHCSNTVPYVVDPAGFNHLRVISRDGHHRFLVNGVEVCGAFDDTFVIGHTGAMMFGPSSNPNHFLDVDSFDVRLLPPGVGVAGTSGNDGEDSAALSRTYAGGSGRVVLAAD